MEPLTKAFDDRLQEIDEYLSFLAALEVAVQNGTPRIGDMEITAEQQKILYSSVYLQLYNLVEATVTWCIEAVTNAAVRTGSLPGDLCAGLRREWIRFAAQTHEDLSYENRLQSAVGLCDRLISSLPLEAWRFARSLGNWDDERIEKVTKRIDCKLRINPQTLSGIKRKIRDDKTPLGLVKHLRNRLAHGTISFVECGDGITVDDLRELKDKTATYLREVVVQFEEYINGYQYLLPEKRPNSGATA